MMACVMQSSKAVAFRRTVGIGLCVAALALAMVWARTFYGAYHCCRKGDRHLREGRYVRAVTYYDRALHWYSPFNPYVQKSAARLWEIGLTAERKGDIRLALISYRTLRRGFHAAANVFLPGKKWIKRCDMKITAFSSRHENGWTARTSLPTQRFPVPDVFWSLVVEAGFLGWIGCLIVLILRLMGAEKSVRYSRAPVAWGGLAVVFFGLWILGMMRA